MFGTALSAPKEAARSSPRLLHDQRTERRFEHAARFVARG
jgi:hypothetical protein